MRNRCSCRVLTLLGHVHMPLPGQGRPSADVKGRKSRFQLPELVQVTNEKGKENAGKKPETYKGTKRFCGWFVCLWWVLTAVQFSKEKALWIFLLTLAMSGRHLEAAAVTAGEGLREAHMSPTGGLFTPELRSQGQPAPVPRAPLGFSANH